MHDGAPPQIFKNAAKLRQRMTEPEKILWEALKTKPFGFKFRRQHPINYYILDFYCHQKRLSIEVDGGYHLAKKQKERDKRKIDYLNSVDIREIRFSNEEVLHQRDSILQKIKLALETELETDS
ncbi:endonuclease domain-containing protein [Flavobacteriaceae bacterium TP-CH-4]|uniref:Endonuclease domain-containing protein n=2 Tax=Pelagihabitans pacificus TaxID=2696054 RepID=A0A967AUF9_9FLAO|nr:endonuclease domain-containing protein [Pelagihabitans pacificus]